MSAIVPPPADAPEDIPLFGGYEPPPAPEPEPPLSADRRRTLRQAQQIAAGLHPLTGQRLHLLASRHRDATAPKSDPFTCGSCYFREVWRYHGRSYAKCVFSGSRGADEVEKFGYPRVSHGAATDVRAWWPACPDYSPGDSLSPDAARSIPGAAS